MMTKVIAKGQTLHLDFWPKVKAKITIIQTYCFLVLNAKQTAYNRLASMAQLLYFKGPNTLRKQFCF